MMGNGIFISQEGHTRILHMLNAPLPLSIYACPLPGARRQVKLKVLSQFSNSLTPQTFLTGSKPNCGATGGRIPSEQDFGLKTGNGTRISAFTRACTGPEKHKAALGLCFSFPGSEEHVSTVIYTKPST